MTSIKVDSERTEEEVRQGDHRGSNGDGSFRTFEPTPAPTPAPTGEAETGLFGGPCAQAIGGNMNIKDIAERAHTTNEAKGFNDGWRNEPDQILVKLALVHTETSEAVEAVRDGDMALRVREDGKPEGYPSELADIIIRTVHLARLSNVDLVAAIEAKMQFNETRPFNHGRSVRVEGLGG